MVSSDGPGSKTAFVFAGGGSFGAIQVGMLRALANRGITADMVVGSSVGALNGAYYAGDPTIEEIRRLETIWRGLRRRDMFPLGLRTTIGFLYRRDFLVASDGLRRLVDKNLAYNNLQETKIPVHIVTTDILTGGSVVLSEGPAAQAIIASAAIPAVFAPVKFNNLYLADGAVSSNTAVKVAVAYGARRLIVLPTGCACALNRPPVGAVANALHALTLLIARQLVAELESLDDSIEFFSLPPPCPFVGSPNDFSQTGELIERAASSTEAWIAGGGFDRPGALAQLSRHKHTRLAAAIRLSSCRPPRRLRLERELTAVNSHLPCGRDHRSMDPLSSAPPHSGSVNLSLTLKILPSRQNQGYMRLIGKNSL